MSLLVTQQANAETLSFEEVLRQAYQANPSLQMSQLQVKVANAEANQLEGALDTRYRGSVGFSDEVSPTVNPFSASQTRTSFISGSVEQPFSGGSTLTGTLNYNSAKLTYPSTVPSTFQANPNPIYKHQIDLIYRYPLVSGAGNASYHAQRDASAQESKAARLRVEMLKEQVASQAVALYFQLILSDLSLELADDGVVRAKQLLAYQKKRESFGLIEEADRFQAEALLAMRKLQQVQALAARDSAQTSLNRLMFQKGDQLLKPKLNPIKIKLASMEKMLLQSERNRPVFEVLKAQYAAAESRLMGVEDLDKYQLDLVGQVGSRALDGSAGNAFAQGFTLDDRYVGLHIEFSDVWNRSSSRALIQKNVLQLENIKLERKKTRENIETDLAAISVLLGSGEVTLKASKKQVFAEKKKFDAEASRYREGRSTTAVITQFEGDLRAAELRALIQQVSLDQAKYRLALTLGVLPSVLGAK